MRCPDLIQPQFSYKYQNQSRYITQSDGGLDFSSSIFFILLLMDLDGCRSRHASNHDTSMQ